MSKNIVIVLLLFVVVYLFLNPKKEVEYKTITNTIMINDSSYSQLIDTLILVDLPSNIDTMQVINDYYSKFNYKREYSDEYINIQLNDTIFQNQIFSGNLEYTIKNYSIKNSEYRYGIGLTYLYSQGIGLSTIYNKNRIQYSLSYFPHTKNLSLGILWKF